MHILARAKHKQMLEDLKLNEYSDVENFYQIQIKTMTDRAKGLEARYGRQSPIGTT